MRLVDRKSYTKFTGLVEQRFSDMGLSVLRQPTWADDLCSNPAEADLLEDILRRNIHAPTRT